MASVKKYARSAVKNILDHNLRAKPVKNADAEKTHHNYSLTPVRFQNKVGKLIAFSPFDYFKKRLREVYVYNRKDVKVLAEWIVTAPKDLPESEHKRFFKACYEFMERKYGKNNIVSAHVHMDESQPHLHTTFLPVVPDKKRGGEKVCANDVLTRITLSSFHGELQAHLNNAEIPAKITSGITKAQGGNRTVSEMKQERKPERQRLQRGVFYDR